MSDLGTTIRAARFYRGLGTNVLPSRADRKAPAIKYANLWDRPLRAEHFDRIAARQYLTRGRCNLQVMTGVRWGLAVIDLDGPTPIEVWASWTRFRSPLTTWQSCSFARDGSVRGMHVWYSLPPDHPPVPSRLLWGLWDQHAGSDGKGSWAKRSQVELKADRGLVMVPPSVHPATCRPYEFLPGHGPADVARPAPLPDWVLVLPTATPPKRPRPMAPLRPLPPLRPLTSGFFDRSAVVDAIPDKLALAAEWGLRLAGTKPNAAGWVSCHSLYREDRTPSASFSVTTGRYWEAQMGRNPISLFDLAVERGRYSTWTDAVRDLGSRFGAPMQPIH